MSTLNTSMLPTLPTTPQASVASMIMPSTPALGRLPATQVAGTVPEPEIRNEAQNNPPYLSLQPDPAAATSIFSNAATAQSSYTTISVFPSLFLAQLIGQGGTDPQTMNVISSYTPAHNAQTPPDVNANASLMQLQSVRITPPGNGNNTLAPPPQAPPANTTAQAAAPEAAALPQPAATAPTPPAPRRESARAATDASYNRKIQAYLKPMAADQALPAEAGFEPSLA